jgi:hypothetical protein
MDRATDHSSAKGLKIWRREWDSNPSQNVVSKTWKARTAFKVYASTWYVALSDCKVIAGKAEKTVVTSLLWIKEPIDKYS